MQRGAPLLLALVGLACLALARAADVHGKIIVPDGTPNPNDAEVVLMLESGSRRHTFPTGPEGRFSFRGIPTGKHLVEVDLLGLVYSAAEVTVEADGSVSAVLSDVHGRPPTAYPLIMRAAGRLEFFQKSQPFNILAFLKTPYGLMIAFMVFSLFILPKLRVDPEELRRSTEGEGGDEAAAGAVAAPRQSRKDR